MSRIKLEMDMLDMEVSVDAECIDPTYSVNTQNFLTKLEALLKEFSMFDRVNVKIESKDLLTYGCTGYGLGEDLDDYHDGDLDIDAGDIYIPVEISTGETMHYDQKELFSTSVYDVDKYDEFLLRDGATMAWPFPSNVTITVNTSED